MNRAQRRQRERSAKSYDGRKTFTKQELEDMNTHAFKIGTAMALYAAQQTLGLGEVRMDRLRKIILELEDKFIISGSMEALPFDTLEILRYRGLDKRNEAGTTTKDRESRKE